MKKIKLVHTLIIEIIFLICIFIVLLVSKPGRQEMNDKVNDIWENGIETTGTLTKMKQKLTDTGRTIFQIRCKLQYEVEGVNYETECVVYKKDFKKLDVDKDGKASVVVFYDAADPSRATIEPAVTSAKKILKYTKICIWGSVILTVFALLILPVAVKVDRMG